MEGKEEEERTVRQVLGCGLWLLPELSPRPPLILVTETLRGRGFPELSQQVNGREIRARLGPFSSRDMVPPFPSFPLESFWPQFRSKAYPGQGQPSLLWSCWALWPPLGQVCWKGWSSHPQIGSQEGG